MRRIKVDPPVDPKNGAMGTLFTLRLVLSTRCPKMGTYEDQRTLYRITRHIDQSSPSVIFLDEADYAWIMEHLKSADYSGMVVGKMLEAFENADAETEPDGTSNE